LGATLAAVSVLASCTGFCSRKPDIPFAPSGQDYRAKMDFARLERLFPLTRADLMKLTPQNVARLSQEELDQVYARLTAGPIPEGVYDGTFFLAEGGGLRRIPAILGGLKGEAMGIKLDLLEHLGGRLWQGKVFDRGRREARDLVRDRASADWLAKTLGMDQNSLLGMKTPDGSAWLIFPAKLYCGQSLLDGRRESIILDHAFGDEIPGYRATIDRLAGRNGARMREEVRLVRPGFYLGRTYLDRVFVLNFTLLSHVVEREGSDAFRVSGRIEEDCWPGTQRRIASN